MFCDLQTGDSCDGSRASVIYGITTWPDGDDQAGSKVLSGRPGNTGGAGQILVSCLQKPFGGNENREGVALVALMKTGYLPMAAAFVKTSAC